MDTYPVQNPVLQTLFDPNLPNSPALWAVLKGNHTGKALVDCRQCLSQCVLRTDAALSYFSCETDQSFLNEAIAYFREIGPVWLVWPQRTSLEPPDIEEAEVIKRIEFYDYDRSSEVLQRLRKQLATDHQMVPIDAQLLKSCEWREEMEFYAGSFDGFLMNGIGVCMMRSDEIIVEAYASALGQTRAEIGAITREPYRGKSYAAIACAHLIEAVEQRGYKAYWSCDADHQASIRVAQKLGFQQQRAYTIYEYKARL